MTPLELSRRRYPRIPAESAVLVNLLGKDPGEKIAVTRNMSLGGCAFASSESCGIGAHLKLLITVEGHIVRARAQVTYENRLSDGRFEIGAEFLEISDLDRDRIGRLFLNE